MKQTPDFKAFVESLVREYERDGYSVVVEPDSSRMPAKLRSFEPDLLARRGDERVVVEIRGPGLKRPSDEARALASAIEAHDNWRLDLVFYEPEEERRARIAGPTTIKRSIGESRQLFKAGQKAAAMLLAWSALEASAIRAIDRQAGEAVTLKSPHELLKNLVFYGLLPESELPGFSRIADKRNRTAHGGLNQRVPMAEFERICELSARLLDLNTLEVT